MEIKQALKVVEALQTIGECLGMELHEVGSFVCLGDQERMNTLNDAISQIRDFYSKPLVERGAMLGITITEHP